MTLMFSPPSQDETDEKTTKPTDTVEEASDKDPGEKPHKIKIIASLLIVGVATYLAYWAQTPDITHNAPKKVSADVFNASEQSGTNPSPSITSPEKTDTTKIAADVTTNGQEVTISDFSFSPANLTVSKGMTVTWKNKDSVSHTVSSNSFSSGTLAPGDSYSYTFNALGTFEYTCSFHPQMKGTVVVEDTGAAASDTTTSQPSSDQATSPAPSSTVPVPAANSQSSTPKPAATETTTTKDDTLIPVDTTNSVTLNPQELLSDTSNNSTTQPTVEKNPQPKPAAQETKETVNPKKLATTGPEDWLYVALAVGILYVNRRKLGDLFNK